jgi:hypothetical protein
MSDSFSMALTTFSGLFDGIKEIDKRLDTAEIILLLVTANFLNSRYCYSVEM